MILKKKIDWRKHVLTLKFSYVIENKNEMIYIHDNEVKNIAGCNLLHDIINPSKRDKNIHPLLNTIWKFLNFARHFLVFIHPCRI